jgi:hypothetical protein
MTSWKLPSPSPILATRISETTCEMPPRMSQTSSTWTLRSLRRNRGGFLTNGFHGFKLHRINFIDC